MQHQAVTQGIDATRDAARLLINRREHVSVKSGPVGRTRTTQAVLDVAPSLFTVHRPQVATGRHPLAQLQHVGALQDVAELGLTDQEGLQQGLLAMLKIGQHAQLFDGLLTQVLRLIDDEKATFALGELGDEEGFERLDESR